MKYHLQLLKKYLSLNVDAENIAQNLILKTCEIEEIEERKLAETIVIGKVESFEKHPDADKLNVCQVNCGAKGQFQIVCGGENIETNIYVPVALVGTSFEKLGMTIAKRAVRGIDSEGMICAKTELGIAEDQDQHWIWNLGLDLEVGDEDLGMMLKEKFPRLETTVLEVDNKSLTNRPDLTGHFAAAIELNAIFPNENKQYGKIKEYMESFNSTNILDLLEHSEKKFEKQILCQTDAVNSYIALALKGIEVKKSDFFTRLQLIDLGANPLNNRVDFSNLFMNISGQPIHFFDADKIKGNIILREAKEGETFIDLFGAEHQLESCDLVIADEEKILALAGIIGGEASGVTENTKNILVEIANFDPVKVRKTGTRLGLRTDAELRFEKNISPKYSLYALLLFLDELKYYGKSLGNFEIGGLASYIKSNINPLAQKSITVDWNAVQKLIFGVEMENFEEKARKILTDLGFHVQGNQVLIPLWRGPDDMNIQEDIAEEIARIWGYDTIAEQPLLAELKDQPMSQEAEIMRSIENLMVQELHFDQVETYPWTSENLIKQFGSDLNSLYQLQNPLNPEFPYLRDKMSYNFLPIAQKNSKFFDSFKLFDIGKVWTKSGLGTSETLDPRYANAKIKEELMLGAIWYQKSTQNWQDDTILEAKGTVEKMIKSLGIKGKIFFEKSDFNCFHPKKQAKILLRNGATPLEIGTLATLHPLLLQQNKFPETAQVSLMELNLELLKSLTKQQSYEKDYETLQDQLLWRDLSFVLEANEDFGKLIESLEKMQTIQEVRVFDLYQGANLGEGKKSISLQIKIKGDGNMTTEQINSILQDAIKKGESTGAKLRA